MAQITKKVFDDVSRLQIVKQATIFGFIAGILLCPKLWTSDRSFPLLPPFEGFQFLSFPGDFILTLMFASILLVWAFVPKTQLGIFSLVLLMIILLHDQMRWQPWVYLYSLILLVLIFDSGKQSSKETVISLQLIISGVYVWSGIHKMNSDFIDTTFVDILSFADFPLTLKNWGYFIPLIEILSGIFLLLGKVRKIGVILVTVITLFILGYFGPFGRNENSVIYPWNIVMICVVWSLFWNLPPDYLNFKMNFSFQRIFIILLVWLLPILNLFHSWDHYLSFSLYSDKTSGFYIAVQEKELGKIDSSLHNYFVKLKNVEGGKLIDINRWAVVELNVPFYPETRTFKQLAATFCGNGIEPCGLAFVEISRVNGSMASTTYFCNNKSSVYPTVSKMHPQCD